MTEEEMERNKIKNEIINFLKSKKKCSFGDMVKELGYSYNQILESVIELKKDGEIYKSDKSNGYYSLA